MADVNYIVGGWFKNPLQKNIYACQNRGNIFPPKIFEPRYFCWVSLDSPLPRRVERDQAPVLQQQKGPTVEISREWVSWSQKEVVGGWYVITYIDVASITKIYRLYIAFWLYATDPTISGNLKKPTFRDRGTMISYHELATIPSCTRAVPHYHDQSP